MVAESLSAQIEHYRSSLDHRSLFSAGFNRKLVRRIELLDSVREYFLEVASELQRAEKEVLNEEINSRAPGSSTLFSAGGAPTGRFGGR